MTVRELKEAIGDFYNAVSVYRKLLSKSGNRISQRVVRNVQEIQIMRFDLVKTYAGLEDWIKLFSRKPLILYTLTQSQSSAYDVAFSTDILMRVGDATDAVLSDLTFILGKLEKKDPDEIISLPGSVPPHSVDVEKMTKAELFQILRRNENPHISTSLYNRAKNELDLRDREKKSSETTYLAGRDIIKVESLSPKDKAMVSLGGGFDDEDSMWYQKWWMTHIVFPILTGLAVVALGIYFFHQ